MHYEIAYFYYTFATYCTVITKRPQIRLVALQCAEVTIVVYGRSQDLENTRFCQTTTVHQKLCLFVCLSYFSTLQFSVDLSYQSSVGVHGILVLIQLNSLAMLVYTP